MNDNMQSKVPLNMKIRDVACACMCVRKINVQVCIFSLTSAEQRKIEKAGWLGQNVQQSTRPNFVGFVQSDSEESEDSAVFHDGSDSDAESDEDRRDSLSLQVSIDERSLQKNI